jgi:hypothetical protein
VPCAGLGHADLVAGGVRSSLQSAIFAAARNWSHSAHRLRVAAHSTTFTLSIRGSFVRRFALYMAYLKWITSRNDAGDGLTESSGPEAGNNCTSDRQPSDTPRGLSVPIITPQRRHLLRLPMHPSRPVRPAVMSVRHAVYVGVRRLDRADETLALPEHSLTA